MIFDAVIQSASTSFERATMTAERRDSQGYEGYRYLLKCI